MENDLEKFPEGWSIHPGTHCGHWFDKGETKSLCRKEYRGANSNVKADSIIKCTICERRKNSPRTINLFG